MHTVVFHRLGYSWHVSALDACTTYSIQALVTLVLLTVLKYYQPERNNRIYLIVFSLVGALLISYAINSSLHLLLNEENEYLAQLDATMPLRYLSALLFLLFFSIVYWLNNSLHEQQAAIKRKNETEQLAREAELMKLRQQLQPHFLFNSLNSISALALTQPDEARNMIQLLSDFLRGTLKKENVSELPLREEWLQLQRYLQIEKVRFGHRLQIITNEDEACADLLLPPLLLQPLVENAIKFGLYGITGMVTITITAKHIEQYLVITIENPVADDAEASQGTGFGLHSIARRLYLQYGRNDLLKTEKTNGQFRSELRIPQ